MKVQQQLDVNRLAEINAKMKRNLLAARAKLV